MTTPNTTVPMASGPQLAVGGWIADGSCGSRWAEAEGGMMGLLFGLAMGMVSKGKGKGKGAMLCVMDRVVRCSICSTRRLKGGGVLLGTRYVWSRA